MFASKMKPGLNSTGVAAHVSQNGSQLLCVCVLFWMRTRWCTCHCVCTRLLQINDFAGAMAHKTQGTWKATWHTRRMESNLTHKAPGELPSTVPDKSRIHFCMRLLVFEKGRDELLLLGGRVDRKAPLSAVLRPALAPEAQVVSASSFTSTLPNRLGSNLRGRIQSRGMRLGCLPTCISVWYTGCGCCELK